MKSGHTRRSPTARRPSITRCRRGAGMACCASPSIRPATLCEEFAPTAPFAGATPRFISPRRWPARRSASPSARMAAGPCVTARSSSASSTIAASACASANPRPVALGITLPGYPQPHRPNNRNTRRERSRKTVTHVVGQTCYLCCRLHRNPARSAGRVRGRPPDSLLCLTFSDSPSPSHATRWGQPGRSLRDPPRRVRSQRDRTGCPSPASGRGATERSFANALIQPQIGDVTRVGRERAALDLAHDLGERRVGGRGDIALLALGDDEAVEEVDLGASPLDHVLRHGRALLGGDTLVPRQQLRLDIAERRRVAFAGARDELGREVEHLLELIALRLADADGLAAEPD